jgi:hypothetical protein
MSGWLFEQAGRKSAINIAAVSQKGCAPVLAGRSAIPRLTDARGDAGAPPLAPKP